MSTLRSDLLINPSELYDLTVSTNGDGTQLGQLATTGDGRYFRYIYAGGVALVPGTLLQAPAEVTGSQGLAVAAAAIGATSITTTSTVTCAANDFAGGYVVVTTTPGQGYMYQIGSHAAASAAVVTLNLVDPIVVALTTASRIDLVSNIYGGGGTLGVIINPATATSCPVGLAVAATPINYYGWAQVRGVGTVLMDAGTGVVGTAQSASNATAGAIEPFTGVQAIVGTLVTGVAATEYGAINLQLS